MPDLEDHDRRLNTEKKEVMADNSTRIPFICYLPGHNPSVMDNLSGTQKSIWWCSTEQIDVKGGEHVCKGLTKQMPVESKTPGSSREQASCGVHRQNWSSSELTRLDYFLES